MLLGTIEIAYAVFASESTPSVKYVVGVDSMDYLEFLKKFNSGQSDKEIFRKVTGVDLSCEDKHFFLCYHEDCMDPTATIVRANCEDEAVDKFVDECPWARENEDDLDIDDKKNGPNISFTDRGYAYNTETIRVVRVKCVSVAFS